MNTLGDKGAGQGDRATASSGRERYARRVGVPRVGEKAERSMVGTFGSDAEREQFKTRIREQYETQGSPYYSTARLWDDGVIDPLDTRRVLALGIAAARHAPIEEPRYGVFRM
jgi:3-methylcrotonyl-CoA carboxylase beta subunit